MFRSHKRPPSPRPSPPVRGRTWRRVLRTLALLYLLPRQAEVLSTLQPPNHSIPSHRGKYFSLSPGAHLYQYLLRWTPWVSKPPSLRPNGPSEPSPQG